MQDTEFMVVSSVNTGPNPEMLWNWSFVLD